VCAKGRVAFDARFVLLDDTNDPGHRWDARYRPAEVAPLGVAETAPGRPVRASRWVRGRACFPRWLLHNSKTLGERHTNAARRRAK
jgi:hypothetical protein